MRAIRRFEVVDSTQDEARRLVRAKAVDVGDIILADEQRAGRGRFGRTWISPRGGLYATFVLEPQEVPSIRAGLAVVRALAELGLEARLKWPNDVLASGKKIAGVLIEAVDDVLLVGIGVNLMDAPLPATTSARECGVDIDRDSLVVALGRALHELAPRVETLAAYRTCCETIGRSVHLSRADVSPVEGVAVDVDEEGRLVVETGAGRVAVASAECHHLESTG